MSTTNHSAIVVGAAANAGTINGPLGQLDAAMGDVDALTTRRARSRRRSTNWTPS